MSLKSTSAKNLQGTIPCGMCNCTLNQPSVCSGRWVLFPRLEHTGCLPSLGSGQISNEFVLRDGSCCSRLHDVVTETRLSRHPTGCDAFATSSLRSSSLAAIGPDDWRHGTLNIGLMGGNLPAWSIRRDNIAKPRTPARRLLQHGLGDSSVLWVPFTFFKTSPLALLKRRCALLERVRKDGPPDRSHQ